MIVVKQMSNNNPKDDKTLKGTPAFGPDDKTLVRGDGEEESTPARKIVPPYAVVVDGPHTGVRFPLREDAPNIIGRSVGNAIRLEDQSVSRQHAEITKGTSGWMIRDLGSKNGTLVNGVLITDSVVIGHKDVVKSGIYQVRLITQPVSLEEELTLPPEIAMADRTIFVSTPSDGLTAEVRKAEGLAAEEYPEVPEPENRAEQETDPEIPALEAEEPPNFIARVVSKVKTLDRRRLVLFGGLAFVVVIAIIYFGARFFKPHKVAKIRPVPAITEEAKPSEEQPLSMPAPAVDGPLAIPSQPAADAGAGTAPADMPPSQPGAPPPTDVTANPGALATPQPPVAPVVAPPAVPSAPSTTAAPPIPAAPSAPSAIKVPIFVDFASSPMPVKVEFQGKEIGQTPIRVNIELEPGLPYTAKATFNMPEIGQQYSQQVDFTVPKDQSVVPVFFRGPIGMLKVMDLPRDVQFYLEGKFSYDKFQEQSAKLQEVVLQKPIYIPYGRYALELRRSKQLGATSPNYVPDIIFRRDFVIAEDSPAFTLEVKEQDLAVFPAKVKSIPPNSDVFVDGKLVGKTPFEGVFPLGEHKLTLRKEGYFDHNEDLKVDINTPYTAEVSLKTSIAGTHINNARLAMNRAMYQEAINELAEALNNQPVPSEVAQINFFLGICYLRLNDFERALSYFEKAKTDETQKMPATLGMASSYAMLGKMDNAMPLLVEVFLKAKDEQTKRDAHDLFLRISPLKSIVYVYSDPSGAKVTVNDKPVAQMTPVILHEMPLGNYKIKIDKPGYLPTEMTISLSVNEFTPIIVKLKPIPQ